MLNIEKIEKYLDFINRIDVEDAIAFNIAFILSEEDIVWSPCEITSELISKISEVIESYEFVTNPKLSYRIWQVLKSEKKKQLRFKKNSIKEQQY